MKCLWRYFKRKSLYIFGNSKLGVNSGVAVWCILLGAIYILGLSARYRNLGSQFTHIDDIGVAWTLLSERYFENPNFSKCSVANFWESLSCKLNQRLDAAQISSESTTVLGKAINIFGIRDTVKAWLVPIYEFHEIPTRWTYAPGQFYFTQFLLNSDLSYEQIKRLGRLPSFLFSSVALALQACLHISACGQNHDNLKHALVSLIIAAFAWQSIFFSGNMSNFATAQMCVTALGLTLFCLAGKENPSEDFSSLKIGLLLTAVSIMTYQSLFFIPAFMFTLFVIEANKRKAMSYKLLKASAIFGITFFPFFYLFLLNHLKSGAGIGWNSGPNDEFVFTGSVHVLSDVFFGLLKFIALFPTVMEAMLAPNIFGSSFSPLLKGLLTIMFVTGLIRCIKKRENASLALVIFFLTSFATWLGLWVLGAISFGPTRHSLVWSMFFIYFSVTGLMTLVEIVKSSFWRSILFASICMFWPLTFFSSAGFYDEVRRDYYDEDFIASKFKELEVNIIISDMKNSASFMPQLRTTFPVIVDKVAPEKIVYKTNNVDEVSIERIRIGLIGSSECFLTTTMNPNLIVQTVQQTLGINLNDDRAASHKVLFHEKDVFDVEFEWSAATTNGKNDYCLKVIEI